jgi:ATP-dependent Clp protease ATP-binding subunit ClpC
MFERYTETARRTIFFARYEAAQNGSTTIELPHLLLGLMRQSSSTFQRIATVDREALEFALRSSTSSDRPKISTSVDLPFSQACKRVLALAAEESELLGDAHIGAEHLLLGVLGSDSRESRLLAPFGITLDAARLAFLEPEGETRNDYRITGRSSVTREEVQRLLAELPDDRLQGAAYILTALARRDFKFPR